MNSPFYTSIGRYGNSILYRGYDANGERIQKRIKYKPRIFIEAKDDALPTGWTSLYGHNVKPVEFETMAEMKDFVKQYEHVPSFEMFGSDKHLNTFVQSRFPGKVDYDDRMINVGKLDIETEVGEGFPDPRVAEQAIRAITILISRDNTYHVWGCKRNYKPHLPNLEYHFCNDEEDLLKSFLIWWQEPWNQPDVITGWNTRFFDIPYLVNRIDRVLGAEKSRLLSPWKQINSREINQFNVRRLSFEIEGIQHLDYMELFKKFAYTYGNQESYALNHIAHIVLGEEKLDYSDIGSLNDLYDQDFQRFIEYNVKDVTLVDDIDKKLGFIDIVFTISYMAGTNYSDTLATTPIWDGILYRYLIEQKIVPMLNNGNKPTSSYPGGYVKFPAVGMHNWVMSFDLNSLYPSLIIQGNMSTETICQKRDLTATVASFINETFHKPEPGVVVAANGAQFRTDKAGIIPNIVRDMYAKRKDTKSRMIKAKQKKEKVDPSDPAYAALTREVSILENNQMALKILLNSLYGAIANKYFRYFDLRIAEGITLTGQAVIQFAEKIINEKLNELLNSGDKDRVIASDTDSLYISVDDIVAHFKPKNPLNFLNEFGEKFIEPIFIEAFTRFAENHGATENRMVMAREVIADRGIWTAKKRYILNVLDSEGVRYAEPKIKIMGLQSVQSSTPQICRDEMKKIFKIIMTEDEEAVQASLAKFKKKFAEAPVEEIAFPRSISDVEKYLDLNKIYIKGTTIHARGSLLYNHMLMTKGLTKYRRIFNGDKIKFIYLKTPNPINENVIAFPDNHLPVELGLHKYVDIDLQFQKAYVGPIKAILDVLGWTTEPQASLEDFFG